MSITNNNANSQSLREDDGTATRLSSLAQPDVFEESGKATSSRHRQHGSTTSSLVRDDDSPRVTLSSSVRAGSPQLGYSDLQDSNINLQRHKRSSGGFLLDGLSTSVRSSQSFTPLKNEKGKRRDTDGAVSITKRRRPLDSQDSPISVASSGLSSTGKLGDRNPTRVSRDISNNYDFGNTVRRQDAEQSTQGVSYGFDTDPAQIVSMALALNEGRRRQAHNRRLVSSATERSRVASNYTNKSRSGTMSPAAADQSILAQGTARVDGSSDVQPLTPRNDHRKLLRQVGGTGSPTSTDDMTSSPDGDGAISRATQNRVQKVKTYFELAYEHRRLLPHLPPLRRPGTQTSSTLPEGKVYNPLQYARNRKLRFREQQPLDAEGEGWHDVAKVRAWVDAVTTSHTELRHDPLECVRLPPLSLQAEDGGQDGVDDKKPKRPQSGKPRRPKSDWVTFPGDLLADAHWTEQGLNKRKIYDRDNRPIFPPDTQFRFSGWRNHTPVDVPESLKVLSSNTSPVTDIKDVRPPPTLPHFESVQNEDEIQKSKVRGSSRKEKRGRRRQSVLDYSSDSEASDRSKMSDDREQERRGRRVLRNSQTIHLPDGDPYAKGAEPAHVDHTQPSNRISSEIDSSRRSLSLHSKDLFRRLHRHENSEHTTSESNGYSSKKRRFIGSLSLKRDEDARRSFEDDSTAPSSPVAYGFPSIAINLSPPFSRSPSPTKRAAGHSAIKHKAKSGMEMVETTDFAEQDTSRHSRAASLLPDASAPSDSSGRRPHSRGPSPFSKHKSVSSLDRRNSADRDKHHDSAVIDTSSRAAHPGHRIRGIFKGGRIAAIVNNEVSRVSDYIWKREPPRRTNDDGSISGYESDSEEEPDNNVRVDMGDSKKRPPQQIEISPQSTHTATHQSGKSSSPPEEPYHVPGLPSFTSPFQHDRNVQRDKAREQSPGGTMAQSTEEFAPVSRSTTHANAGRSPRIDRLQPAKIDTGTAQSEWNRRKSYGFSQALDLTRTKSASESFNDAINCRDRRDARPVDAAHLPLIRIPTDETDRPQGTDIGVARHHDVTMQDVLRAQALLLMTAVKSTNITNRWNDYPQPQSPFLLRTLQRFDPGKVNYLRARRKEEHQIAAATLIALLTDQTALLNDHLASFSTNTTPSLHRDLQLLEDSAETTLFPRLRDLSDHAAHLAQNLTTTSTLAIRSVNDSIAHAAKMKRRGVFRFARRAGFSLAEWAVVGLLWLIWLVAMVVRFVGGVILVVWRAVAWLFWLR